MRISDQMHTNPADISGKPHELPPVPSNPTAVAMFTAHRVNDVITELAHSVERMQLMRKTSGDLRHYHTLHFDNHLKIAMAQADLLRDNMLEHYPAEAAEWKALNQVMDLASGYTLNKRSGMISLDLPPGTVAQVPGGVDDHHVTVVYLGPDVDDEAYAEACRRAQEAASAIPGPINGTVGGIGTFKPSGGSDGKTVAWTGAVLPGADQLRSSLQDLSASEHKDWKTHITLAYLDPGEALPDPVPPTPVTLTHLSVHRGKDVVRYPLGGGPVEMSVAVNPAAKAASFAHLLQTIMYDGAHARRHSTAMLADTDDKSWAFDADHADKHMQGAREHACKLSEHIVDNYPDEAEWLEELVKKEELSTISGQAIELNWDKWDAEHAKTGDAVHDSLAGSRPKLNSQQAQRVRHFTGDGFSEMNRRLRSGAQDEADRHGADEMDKIVRGSVAQHDMVLLHGRNHLDDVKPGDTVHEKGFTSTTTDGTAAKTYAGVGKSAAILRVRLKKGESALSTRGLSDNPAEHEVVLPKGQSYKVLKVQTVNGQFGQPVRLVDVETQHSNGITAASISAQALELTRDTQVLTRLPGGIMPSELISAQMRAEG